MSLPLSPSIDFGSLYLTAAEVAEARKNQNLQELIQKRNEEIRTIRSQHPRLFESYTLSSSGTLIVQDENTKMLPSTLFTVMLQVDGLMQNFKKDLSKKEDVKSDQSLSKGIKITIDKELFLAKCEAGKLHLVRWTDKTFLGDGLTSNVWKVLEVVKGVFIAFKEARDSTLLPDFQREARLLRGLEDATLFHIDEVIGIPLELATSDLYDVIDKEEYSFYASLKHRLSYCMQFMAQWFVLSDQGIFHGDLKPENMMWIREKEEVESKGRGQVLDRARVKISDLGGARDLSFFHAEASTLDLEKWEELSQRLNRAMIGINTPLFLCSQDLENFCGALKKEFKKLPLLTKSSSQDNIREVIKFLERYKNAMEKRDIYALGVSCFGVLTGKLPFPLITMISSNNEELETLNVKFPFDSGKCLRRIKCSLPLRNVLQEMCHPQYDKRPSKEVVQAAWQKITLDNGFQK